MKFKLIIYRDCKPYLGVTEFKTLNDAYEYIEHNMYGDPYYNRFDPITDELIEFGVMNIKTKKEYFVNPIK